MSAASVMHWQFSTTGRETFSSVKRAQHTGRRKRRDDQFQELHAQRILRSENDAERRYTRSGRGKAKSDTKERKPDAPDGRV
jgi:hypothetical protein